MFSFKLSHVFLSIWQPQIKWWSICVLNNNMSLTMCFSDVSEVYSRLLPAICICVLDKDMCLDMCFPDESEHLISRISLIVSIFAWKLRYVFIFVFFESVWIFRTSNMFLNISMWSLNLYHLWIIYIHVSVEIGCVLRYV